MLTCRLLCLLLCLLPACVYAEGAPLLIGINSGLSEPNLIRRNAEISGIVPDIATALGGALQRRVQVQLLPRKRLQRALQAGDIDGLCLMSPHRLNLPALELRWTPVVFEDIEVIAGLSSSTPIRKVEDLYGKKIGTTLGYRYPLLEADFRSGKIKRDDAPDESLNLRKLLKGRFSYIICKEETALWHNKKESKGLKLQISPLVVERTDLHCVFSPQSQLSDRALTQAVRQLKSAGTLRAITERYR